MSNKRKPLISSQLMATIWRERNREALMYDRLPNQPETEKQFKARKDAFSSITQSTFNKIKRMLDS
jgi:hypothetical protein